MQASTSVTIYLHGWYGQPAYYADDISLDGPGIPPTTTSTTTTSTTTTSTTTTGPPLNTGLPKHVLTGYWQNFYNGARALRLSDVPTTYDIVAVSFADATSVPGQVGFNLDSGLSSQLGGYTDAQFKADVRTLQNRGQKVIISVGGERGTISVGDSNAANNFANSVKSLIANYGFNGVDIDLEDGVNATYMGQALRSIHAGGGTVITMAPQTIDMQNAGAEYFKLALAVKDILTIVNMQYYNSGTMLGCDQKVYGQGHGRLPDRTGLHPVAERSASGPGRARPARVTQRRRWRLPVAVERHQRAELPRW